MEEGVPPQRELMLLVQANDCVQFNKKISLRAASLQELEVGLIEHLQLDVEFGITCHLGHKTEGYKQVDTLRQLPAKAKVKVRRIESAEEAAAIAAQRGLAFKEIEVQKETQMQQEKQQMAEAEFEIERQLQVLAAKKRAMLAKQQQAVAAPLAVAGARGDKFKLLVMPRHGQKQVKAQVTAGSMQQLEQAVAMKLGVPATFSLCPYDKDFGEFVEGTPFEDFPRTAQVELRPKAVAAPAPVEAAGASEQPQPDTAQAQSEASEVAAAALSGMEERMESAKRELQEREQDAERRAAEREASLERKHQKLLQMEDEAIENARARHLEMEAATRLAQKEALEALAAKSKEAEQHAMLVVSQSKAVAADQKAAAEQQVVEAQQQTEAQLQAQAAQRDAYLSKIETIMAQAIDKDGDKDVGRLMDELQAATDPDVVAARTKLAQFRKTERERRKKEFFAAKRANEGAADSAARRERAATVEMEQAQEGVGGAQAAAAADGALSGTAESAEDVARKLVEVAMSGHDRSSIQAAIEAASPIASLSAEVGPALEARLAKAVQLELQEGLKLETVDALNSLITLAQQYKEMDLAAELDTRKDQLIKVKRMLASAKRSDELERINEAVETARQLGVYEKACRELEEIRGGLMAGEQAQVLIKQVLEGQDESVLDAAIAAVENTPQLRGSEEHLALQKLRAKRDGSTSPKAAGAARPRKVTVSKTVTATAGATAGGKTVSKKVVVVSKKKTGN